MKLIQFMKIITKVMPSDPEAATINFECHGDRALVQHIDYDVEANAWTVHLKMKESA